MLRLTLILCIGMFAALMIAGEDRGQLRPGLAEAAAKASGPEASDAIAMPVEEPITVVDASPAEPEAAPVAAPVVARAEPEPLVEPVRDLATEVEEPVFSLATVGTEAVPGAAPEVPDGGTGTIWYVNASSVNVRAEPSTNAEVVGKLAAGEATLVVEAMNSDWARIVIQGDGVEGFVALRYLSASAP